MNQISTSASEACTFYQNLYFWTSTPPLDSSLPSRQWLWTWVQHTSSRHLSMSPRPYPSRLSSTTNDIFRCMQNIWCSVVVKVQNSGVRGLGFVPIQSTFKKVKFTNQKGADPDKAAKHGYEEACEYLDLGNKTILIQHRALTCLSKSLAIFSRGNYIQWAILACLGAKPR